MNAPATLFRCDVCYALVLAAELAVGSETECAACRDMTDDDRDALAEAAAEDACDSPADRSYELARELKYGAEALVDAADAARTAAKERA